MNMKKTIAAIAAGAVAVSAMATTVSALENKSFNYNLVNSVKSEKMGTATVVYTVENVKVKGAETTPENLCIGFVNPSFGAGWTQPEFVTVLIDYADETVSDRTFNFCEYQKEGYTQFNIIKDDLTAEQVIIPAASLQTGDATVTVKVSYKHKGTDDDAIRAVGGQAQIFVESTSGANATALITARNAYDAAVKAANGDSKLIDEAKKTYDAAVANVKFAVPYSVVTAYTKYDEKGEVAKYPFQTGLTNNQEIIYYLQTANVNGGDKAYTNVRAVLNDAIANYDSVTFTFNTAVEKVNNDGEYDADDGDDQYLSFTQHLYNGADYYWYQEGNYANEDTKYVGFDWTGINLFQGALVVNEGLTMSLADTDYFDYTATSLSFDWDAIMDGAATSNAYATYLNSLKLATSSTWYWDSMTVTVSVGEADDVENAAGTEADDETLDEEEAEEEVIEEEAEEEEVVVEEVETEEVEVSNPTTGNASVALAVIPVALAAAAVVAKKRS